MAHNMRARNAEYRRLRASHSTSRMKRVHPGLIPKSLEIDIITEYQAPSSWSEFFLQPLPTVKLYDRRMYLNSLNTLIEETLVAGTSADVPIEAAEQLIIQLELYHVTNRQRILNTYRGRDESEMLFTVYSRLRFMLYGSQWAKSTTTGFEFTELRSRDIAVIIDATTPIFQYTMSKLHIAIKRLLRRWYHIPYGIDIVKYVDHLHRRVCAFVTGAFTKKWLNFNQWCRNMGRGDVYMANSDFLTEMDIYFSEFRRRIIHYEMVSVSKMINGLSRYEVMDPIVLQRASQWSMRMADDVYVDEVKRIYGEEYLVTCVLPGETEMYKLSKKEEGMQHNPQSIISNSRPTELEIFTELAEMKLKLVLDPETRVGDEKKFKRESSDRSLETLLFAIVDFQFRKLFNKTQVRGVYWFSDNEIENYNEAYARSEITAGSAESDDLSTRLPYPLSQLHNMNYPIILSFFNRVCVVMRGHGMKICDDPFSAFCCWIEMLVKHAPTAIPGVEAIYAHIFNGVEYSTDRREREISAIYGRRLPKYAIWKPDNDRYIEQSSVSAALAGRNT